MLDSLVLYAGVITAFLGALLLIRRRTRKAGAFAVVAGVILAVLAAVAWPITEKRVARHAKLLDDAMPVWQFSERHEIEMHAPPERVFQAIHAVTADEIFLFRTLIWIRRGGRAGPESILNVPERVPLLDVATRTTFVYLADVAPREIVVGTVIVAPRVVLATMNFLVTPVGRDRSRVTTETRVYANTPATARRFAVYWRAIHPGSDIIRRMWLRAIRRRAERETRGRHRLGSDAARRRRS